MLAPRTLKILAVLIGVYAVATVLAYRGVEPLELAVMVPYLSLHLFNRLGIPGLLEHGGHCGWGLCAPSVFGWVFMALLWLAIAWLAAWGLAALTFRIGREAS